MRPRLFLHVLSIEARKSMSYRLDFWIQAVVGFAIGVAAPYFLWAAMFAESGSRTIGGFTLRGMVLYYVAVTLLARLVRGPDLVVDVANDIYEGGLNRYLVFPTGYVSFKYAQHLGVAFPFLIQLAIFGTATVAFVGDLDAIGITAGSATMAVASIAVANLLFFLLAYPVQAVAFWADNVWSLVVLLRFATALFGGAMLPLTLFPEAMQRVLFYSPFPCLFHLPVSALLGRVSPAEWAEGIAVGVFWCAVFAAVGRLVWRRGELSYSGVGM